MLFSLAYHKEGKKYKRMREERAKLLYLLSVLLKLAPKKVKTALAGWLSWLVCHPIHQMVEGSISDQGIYLGCGLDPYLG